MSVPEWFRVGFHKISLCIVLMPISCNKYTVAHLPYNYLVFILLDPQITQRWRCMSTKLVSHLSTIHSYKVHYFVHYFV